MNTNPIFKCLTFLSFILVAAGTAFAAPVAKSGEVVILRASSDNGKLSSLGLSARGGSGSRVATVSAGQMSAAATQTTDLEPLYALCRKLIDEKVATHCSPNFYYKASLTPNDTQYGSLWGMRKIQAPEAWELSSGSDGVVVAVIDTGVQLDHPELAANIWTNPGEVVDDGIDNDGNGFVDDIHGYDWPNSDNNPADDQGHGTHVAGTIGAVGNNGSGVAGINFAVKIQALKVLDADGGGYTSDIAAAVEYAGNNGAHVINMSLGGPGYDSVFEQTIRDAGDRGTLVVVAAGNEANDNDSSPTYPAAFVLPNLISVAASNESDYLADFSNYGPGTTQIAAPGVNILSTYIGSSYEMSDGTSMASPHVAGAAALIKAANPGLSVAQLRSLLLEQADSVSKLGGMVQSNRRLNVYRSVAAALGVTPEPRQGPTIDGLYFQSRRIAAKRYRFELLAYLEQGYELDGVADVRITLSCKEQGGKRRTYTKSGTTDSYGFYEPSIKFTGTRAVCQATTANGTKSRRISLRLR